MPEGDISAYSNPVPVAQPRTTNTEPSQRNEQTSRSNEAQAAQSPPTREVAASVDVDISVQAQAISQANEQNVTAQNTPTTPASNTTSTPTASDRNSIDNQPDAQELSTEARELIEDDTAQAIEAQANTDGSATLDILS